jgi:hypothetical protein
MTDQTVTKPRRPPKALYKIINPTLKAMLHSPLHNGISKRLMILRFKGRKSGKQFNIPVGYVQSGNTVRLATQSPWYKNFVGSAPVQMRLRGKERKGVAEVVTDETGLREHFQIMLPDSPQLSQIIGVTLEPDGTVNEESLARARQEGFVGVRIELNDKASA